MASEGPDKVVFTSLKMLSVMALSGYLLRDVHH